MVDLQQKNPYPTLFSYNNYKEPLNSRSGAAINKRACIIHNRQKKRKARVRQTLEPVVDVKLLVNMNSTSYGNPLVVSEEIITTAESDITDLFFYPYVTVPDE